MLDGQQTTMVYFVSANFGRPEAFVIWKARYSGQAWPGLVLPPVPRAHWYLQVLRAQLQGVLIG